MGVVVETRLLVVTDLDGTLLDHDSYDWEPARPSIDALRQRGFPLILNSSKTVAELIPLAQALGTDAPVIAENGSVIGIRDDSPFAEHVTPTQHTDHHLLVANGLSRDTILATAHTLRTERGFRFSGFADWSSHEVAERTGLAIDAADLARQRCGTEPILWEDSEERFQTFTEDLAPSGIRALRGGRFIHLMGDADKVSGMRMVQRLYRDTHPDIHWTTVALGDSGNDLAMLSAADIAVVIPRIDGTTLSPSAKHTITVSRPGPAGWHEAMTSILKDHS